MALRSATILWPSSVGSDDYHPVGGKPPPQVGDLVINRRTNKPCLILRKKTERPDGLGKNAMLWGFDDSVLDVFLAKAESPGQTTSPSEWPSPSEQIARILIEMGF